MREFAKLVNDDETTANAVLTDDIDLSEICGENIGGQSVSWTPIGNSSNEYTGTFDGNGKTIENLYINNTTSANDQGLFGYVGSSGTVQNLTVTGSVAGYINVGGVVGYNSGTFENCAFTGSVSGYWYVGGVVGNNNGGTVTGCIFSGSGKVSGSNSVGGVVGQNINGSVTGCYFLKQNGMNESLQGIGNKEDAEGAAVVDNLTDQKQFEGWDFTDIWRISQSLGFPVLQDNAQDGLPPGLGTEASPYEISTADQLKNFAVAVNTGSEQSAHAKLMNNIDLSSVCGESNSWTPIGTNSNEYTGTFDGANYTISGLYIDSSDNDQGLFGYVGSSGKVQNLTVSGNVSGDWHVGGVVGYNNGGTVTGCIFSGSGSVSGDRCVGGIVGYNGTGATVSNCYNTGTVTGTGDYVGGVVGKNSGSVENCYNTGAVNSSGNNVGGVVGWNISSGNVKNCYNTGSVSGDSYVGGVVGFNSGTVKNCYNTGTGTVTGKISVGGVVGQNNVSGIVTNCYNTGSVSGPDSGSGSYVGGVVGLNSGTNASVTGCYFLKDTAESGIGSGIGDATEKDDTAFHSGEVAWRLQAGQKATGEEDPIPQVWGQSNLNTDKSWPTLVALDKNAQPVYQVTFDYGTSFTDIDERYDHHYANANDNVTLPTSTDPIPSYEGHTLTGWQDENETQVSGNTVTITSDTKFTAQWTKDTVNYTVTVTTSPAEGGTVNGGGTFTENDSVTVSATPASGYTFVAWQEDGEKIENAAATYTFELTGNRNLTAIFAKNEEPEPTPTPTPDPEPSGPSTGDSTGWDDILDELENTAKGDEITIDMGDETKVPAEIFESLAGKDVDVTFDLGDIQWSVNGADIPTDTDFTDLDLGVNLDTHGIPVNVINTITGEVGTVQITLAHNGEFGFTMTLTAPLGKENAGYWANLYHYDEDAEALNFEAAAKIDEDGSVTIPFSHASQYAIVIDTHSHATVDVSDLFIDVTPDAWYKDAVQYAYDNGLMTGVSATEFDPEATTTRAMIVSILARLEGVTTAEAAGFADVNDNDWYATAVNWAANVGVVNGYEDNTFQPNTAITREQLAAILMNYAAYKGEDVSNRADLTSYTDQPSTWAEEAMSWAVAEGLISGVTADTLQPQGAATRAQVAAILQRFLEA